MECLTKDRDALLAFYDFPAEHWKHLRTSNPIESLFATVRHRTVRSKGCLSNKTALAMIYKLVEAAEKNWRRLDGHNQLPIILGVKFTNGMKLSDRKLKPLPPDLFRHRDSAIARSLHRGHAFENRLTWVRTGPTGSGEGAGQALRIVSCPTPVTRKVLGPYQLSIESGADFLRAGPLSQK